MVLWDQYTGIGKPRLFVEPSKPAYLFGFIRANGDMFHNYTYRYSLNNAIRNNTQITIESVSDIEVGVWESKKCPGRFAYHIVNWSEKESAVDLKVRQTNGGPFDGLFVIARPNDGDDLSDKNPTEQFIYLSSVNKAPTIASSSIEFNDLKVKVWAIISPLGANDCIDTD